MQTTIMLGSRIRLAAIAVMAFAVLSTAQGSSYTNDTDWAGADWTLADGDIVAGVHTNVGHLSIPAGVTVTVEPYDPDTERFGRVTIFAASADIEGTLSANEAGHLPGEGEGAGTGGGNTSGGGGAYGGRGGLGSNRQFGEIYGSPFAPSDLGSGGGLAGISYPAGSGGGALRLVVTGTLAVEGTLSSNGGASVNRSGGGSGGSIWLQAGTIEGTGQIVADGGTVGDLTRGGGGGGGRIAIDATQNLFAGTIRAQGKPGFQGGRHGTYAFTSNPNKDLVIAHDIALPPGTNWLFRSLTVQSGVQFEIQSVPGSLEENYADEVVSRIRFTGDVAIPAGAVLSADGLGYLYMQGDGAGTTHNDGCPGGAYGGRGGEAIRMFPPELYGSAYTPDRLGSGGGGQGGTQGFGGNGGGALILEIDGDLTVDGVISSNGTQSNNRGGGGSGGSIWLKVATMAGNGQILADGGEVNDPNRGGGGGGGRIALETAQDNFTGTIRARGASGFGMPGGNGTLNFVSDEARDLVIEHDIALPPGTNWLFQSLTVQPGVRFEIQSIPGTAALDYTNEVASMLRVLNDITVADNAMISANLLGYRFADGPGAGTGANHGAGGGSYGGLGGEGLAGSVGTTYGAPDEADRLGSGAGAAGSTPGYGGTGGGALILEAGGTITVEGSLTVIGADGNARSGGGSGGSIRVTAPVIAGDGVITADGGTGVVDRGGGGGGGRILLIFGSVGDLASRPHAAQVSETAPYQLLFSGDVTADGGEGMNPGGDGSIRYLYMPPPIGTLILMR